MAILIQFFNFEYHSRAEGLTCDTSLLKDWTRLGKLSIVHVAEVPNRRLQSPILSINYPDGERQGQNRSHICCVLYSCVTKKSSDELIMREIRG